MIALAQKRRRKRNPMTEMVHGIAKRRTNKKNITKIEVEAKSVKRIDRESKKKERDLDKPKKMSKSRLNNLKKDRNQKIKIKADKKKSKEIENVTILSTFTQKCLLNSNGDIVPMVMVSTVSGCLT